MKIIFMASSSFALPALESIYKSNHQIIAIYTKAPSPSGRGKKINKTPIHLCAEEHNLPIYTPLSLKDKKEQEFILSLKADLCVVASYGHILPKNIIDNIFCLNIHASLLPKWRGAAPIHRSIIAGDKETGITMMKMDEGLDSGDIIWQRNVPIENLTGGELHDVLSLMGGEMIIETINNIENNNFTLLPQSTKFSYAPKITKDEALINFRLKGEIILKLIQAFNPWPGMYFKFKEQKIKIYKANFEKIEFPYQDLGFIDEKNLSLFCIDGIIKPTLIQPEGKKIMSTQDFLRGIK